MLKRKKISLITLQYINNYGSVLQAYASQMYLEGKGFFVEIVNYTRENCRFDYLKKSMKPYYQQKGVVFKLPFVSDLLVMRWHRRYTKRNEVFEKFRDDRFHLSKEYQSLDHLMKDPPSADFYCVGSDQVWNYFYNDGVLPEYFLRYAPNNAKKFSLSSSLGIAKLEDAENGALIKEYLDGFSLITVRESSGKQILEGLGVNNCHQILDPTLLISKDKWVSTLGLKRKRDYEYVLMYQLSPSEEMGAFAKQIARENGCKLIVISNNIKMSLSNLKMSISGAEIIANPTVEQFLELILYARCIVTDSFHGTAFSLSFNREFFSWLPRKYSSRLTSILGMLNLQDRAITQNETRWKSIVPINYQSVNNVLLQARKEADQLIEEMLISDGE
jgi:hypothetical protein